MRDPRDRVHLDARGFAPASGAGERRRPEQILSTALRRVDVARTPADAFDE